MNAETVIIFTFYYLPSGGTCVKDQAIAVERCREGLFAFFPEGPGLSAF